MEPLLFSGKARSARFVSDSRIFGGKSARFKPSMVTSSKSDSTLKERWKGGVMNMSFSCDDGGPRSPKSSPDSGFDDVFHTMASPNLGYNSGIYHQALSRRKLILQEESSNSMLTSNDETSQRSVTREVGVKSTKEVAERDLKRRDQFVYPISTTVAADPACVKSGLYVGDREIRTTVFNGEPSVRTRHFNQADQRQSLQNMNKGESIAYYERSDPSYFATVGDDSKITIYPGVRKEERISLSDRNSRPSPPEKSGHKDFKSPPRKTSPSRKASRKSPKAHHKNSPKYQTGVEAIIGDSVPLSPSSDSQSEVEGVETAFGPSRKMSEVLESHYTAGSTSAAYSASADSPLPIKMPAPSAGRRRKSLKAFFRVGLFAAKAKRKTNSCDDSISSEVASPPPANRRLVQRRVSRLEMNEPIEDIFSEVTFKTMEKRSSTSDDDQRDDLSDCDIIEDPDVILKSYMEGELSDDEDVETYVFKGTEDEVSHDSNDIIDPKESELLLATPDCTRTDSTDDPLTSETDLR